jgi:DNA-binding transcriptional ArsR family regulator
MQDITLAALEKLFTALSDKTRLRLLSLMAAGEVSVGFLADSLGESQPKISRHLAYLRSTGLVNTRRDGKWIYYAIARQTDASAENVLRSTLDVIMGKRAKPVPMEVRVQAELPTSDTDIYVEPDIYDETDMSEWRPAEIDVFLL